MQAGGTLCIDDCSSLTNNAKAEGVGTCHKEATCMLSWTYTNV